MDTSALATFNLFDDLYSIPVLERFNETPDAGELAQLLEQYPSEYLKSLLTIRQKHDCNGQWAFCAILFSRISQEFLFEFLKVAANTFALDDAELVNGGEKDFGMPWINLFYLYCNEQYDTCPLHIKCFLRIIGSVRRVDGKLRPYFEKAAAEFPHEVFFKRRLASCIAFQKTDPQRVVTLFKEALSLHPGPDNTAHGLLYENAVALEQTETDGCITKSEAVYEEFIEKAERTGHRKIPQACFSLSVFALTSGDLEKGRFLLEKGDNANKRLPPFLRCDAFPKRKLALSLMKLMSQQDLLSVPQETFFTVSRNSVFLERDRLRLARFMMSQLNLVRKDDQFLFGLRTPPPLASVLEDNNNVQLTPIDAEQLLGPRKDKVYKERVLLCVVFSFPLLDSVNQKLCLLISDRNRYHCRLFLYFDRLTTNVSEPRAKLDVGRVIHIKHPYARACADKEMSVRVDDLRTLHITDKILELIAGDVCKKSLSLPFY